MVDFRRRTNNYEQHHRHTIFETQTQNVNIWTDLAERTLSQQQ